MFGSGGNGGERGKLSNPDAHESTWVPQTRYTSVIRDIPGCGRLQGEAFAAVRWLAVHSRHILQWRQASGRVCDSFVEGIAREITTPVLLQLRRHSISDAQTMDGFRPFAAMCREKASNITQDKRTPKYPLFLPGH